MEKLDISRTGALVSKDEYFYVRMQQYYSIRVEGVYYTYTPSTLKTETKQVDYFITHVNCQLLTCIKFHH